MWLQSGSYHDPNFMLQNTENLRLLFATCTAQQPQHGRGNRKIQQIQYPKRRYSAGLQHCTFMQLTNTAPSWYLMAIYPVKQKSSASKAGRQAQGWAWMYCHKGHKGQPLLPPALPMPTALWTCAWPWTYTGIAWREQAHMQHRARCKNIQL